MLARWLLFLLLSLASLPAPVAAQRWGSPAWTVADLGDFAPAAMNDALLIVGSRWEEGRQVPVVWQAGRLHPLPMLSGGAGGANAVSDNGLIVGWSVTAENAPEPPRGHTGAVLWRDGQLVFAGYMPGMTAMATAVNDAGTVAGWGYFGSHALPVLWPLPNAERVHPAMSPKFDGEIRALNAAGLAAGAAGEGAARFPALFTATATHLLPLPGTATGGEAWAVNDAGEAAGHVFYAEAPLSRAVRWRNGRVERLPANGAGRAINDAGWIVGNGGGIPWLWRPGEGVTNLRAVVPGWMVESVVDLDNHGRVLAVAVRAGVPRAVLLLPRSVSLRPRSR